MRVLYFSGVTPVQLNAGFTLMFRHLTRMRDHEVLILTRDFVLARGAELPHRAVRFSERSKNYSRIANRVGSPFFWLEREAARIRRLALPHAKEFRPEVVLTVWGTPYLLAAADLAQEIGAPLALVCHDDFEHMLPPHPKKRYWALKRLAPIYQSAKARICVGPGMVEQLERLYGVARTEIVYPIPEEAPPFDASSRRRSPGEPLRIGFFGEMGGNYRVLQAVAEALEPANAELHVFSHATGTERERIAARPRVYDQGSTDPRGLRDFFRARMDVTLIPQGFESDIFELMRSCFPSKLPEACQIGLPLLVVGPREGSSFRWAAENLHEPAFLDSVGSERLADAIRRLADPVIWESQRQRVAQLAASMFSPQVLHERYERALLVAAHAEMETRMAGSC